MFGILTNPECQLLQILPRLRPFNRSIVLSVHVSFRFSYRWWRYWVRNAQTISSSYICMYCDYTKKQTLILRRYTVLYIQVACMAVEYFRIVVSTEEIEWYKISTLIQKVKVPHFWMLLYRNKQLFRSFTVCYIRKHALPWPNKHRSTCVAVSSPGLRQSIFYL